MIIKTNGEKQGNIINAIGKGTDLKVVRQYENELGKFGAMFINNASILDFETEYERLHSDEKIQQYFMLEVDLDNNVITKSYIETRDNDDINVVHIQELDVKYSEQEKRVIKTFVAENFR